MATASEKPKAAPKSRAAAKTGKNAPKQTRKPSPTEPKKIPLSEEMIVDSDSDAEGAAAPNGLRNTTEIPQKRTEVEKETAKEDESTAEEEEEAGEEKEHEESVVDASEAEDEEQDEVMQDDVEDSNIEEQASDVDEEAPEHDKEALNNDQDVIAVTATGATGLSKSVPVQTDFNSLEDARPARPFVPPERYGKVQTDFSKYGKKFDAKRLEGKKLIYITAPDYISVTEMENLSWKKIDQGTEVFEVDGDTYSLTMDEKAQRRGIRVLLPVSDGFKPVHAKINHVLRLQSAPVLPNLKRVLPDGVDDSQPRKIPKREQPRNIRIRYRPLGVIDDDMGTMGEPDDRVDVEMREAPANASPRKKKKSSENDETRSSKSKEARKTMVIPPDPTKLSSKEIPILKSKESHEAASATSSPSKTKKPSKEKSKDKSKTKT